MSDFHDSEKTHITLHGQKEVLFSISFFSSLYPFIKGTKHIKRCSVKSPLIYAAQLILYNG
jgi:hypothetical protein